jgi:HSP20 family protein
MFDDRVPLIPLCDFLALNAGYLLSFDMPGLERKDIELEIEGDHLFLRGDRKGQHPRSYQRMITLPDDIKNDQIEAHYVNGVLHVAMPKTSATMHRRIRINEGRADSSGRFLGVRARERQRTLNVRAAESQPH